MCALGTGVQTCALPICEEICRSAHVYQRLLERARQSGRLAPNWSPEIAAITLYSTMMGLLDQWLRAPARFDGRKVGVDCINQLCDSFERLPASDHGDQPDSTK